jgi:hypothetical protein
MLGNWNDGDDPFVRYRIADIQLHGDFSEPAR